MIIGIGSDLSDIRRIEKTLKRFGKRFENKIFTDIEQKKAASRKKSGIKTIAGTYAKRFAAKEACFKALGRRLGWKEVEISNDVYGAPAITLHGRAKKHLASLMPKGKKAYIHLSMSDEYPLAQAFVVIEVQ